jgi:hypothetical protein
MWLSNSIGNSYYSEIKILKATIAVLVTAAALMAQGSSRSSVPQFTDAGELVLPADYREWVFLSSGLGMTYGPAAGTDPNPAPNFDNVFVSPAAYRSFVQTGKWPEKTVLILETRTSASKGSINKRGQYQSDLIAIQAEVKDSSRFEGNGWAFFALGKASRGPMISRSATCYSCHPANGAVDNTFVQFYPTLLPIAKEKGTLTPAYLQAH